MAKDRLAVDWKTARRARAGAALRTNIAGCMVAMRVVVVELCLVMLKLKRALRSLLLDPKLGTVLKSTQTHVHDILRYASHFAAISPSSIRIMNLTNIRHNDVGTCKTVCIGLSRF